MNIYPENDYRDYLMHWFKGGEAKNHKYISRKMGKSGKWIYTYAKEGVKTVGNVGKTIGSDVKTYGRDLRDYYNITGKVGTSAKLATSSLVERKKEAINDAIEDALIKNHQKHSNNNSNKKSGVKERQKKAKRAKKIGKALTLYLY